MFCQNRRGGRADGFISIRRAFFIASSERARQFPETVKSSAHSSRRWLSHAGFFAGGLVLGLVAWKSVRPGDAGSSSSAGATANNETRSSHRRSERPAAFQNGTEILKSVAPHIFQKDGQRNRPQSMTYTTYLRSHSKRILEEADKLQPADDVAAAAISVLEKSIARRGREGGALTPEEARELGHLESRIVHWLRADPEAALRHLSGLLPHRFDMTGPVFAVMTEAGADKAIGWVKDSDPPLNRNVNSVLAMFVGSSGDMQDLEKYRQAVTPDQWNQVKSEISLSWPFEKAGELFDFAVSQNSPIMALRLARSRGKEGSEWLMGQLASDQLDSAFKEKITNSQEFRELMRGNPDIPLETRLEIIGKGEPNKDKEQLALEVGSRDVNNALDDASRDWRFAFRSGKVTFEEVYEAVAADLPELAAGSPDAIRLQVFKELAEENGPAAMRALDHTPEPDKWILALKPTQYMFHGVDPQKFYDYLRNIPHDDPVLHQARLESWVSHSGGNIATYSRDYVTWVKNMPEGIDREMAAIGILRSIAGNKEASLVAEVDALVVDPALRARIKAPPPKK